MNLTLPALITALTSLLLLAIVLLVGYARGKYKIAAPATTGHLKFELAYRVQMNTIESTVAFIPVLWLYAIYVNTTWAGILGGVWLVGRIWYAIAYCEDAKKRGPGFGLSFLAFIVLLAGSLIGIIRQML